MTNDTRQRKTDAQTELVKRFQSAGLEVTVKQFCTLYINQHRLEIDEKETGTWHRTGTGKLYVRFDDADHRTKLFHEKKGTFDYKRIVDEFVEVLAGLDAREKERSRTYEARLRVNKFTEENKIPGNVTIYVSPFTISVKYVTEEQIYKMALLINGVLKEAKEDMPSEDLT